MTSLTRKMKRARGIYADPKPDHAEIEDDAVFRLHPTKGYKRVSMKRVMANAPVGFDPNATP